jgi:hypothetical protein
MPWAFPLGYIPTQDRGRWSLETYHGSHFKMDKPLNTNRPIRVVIIGAGASGLLMAYKLQRNFDDLDFQIYEKKPRSGWDLVRK